MGFVIQRIITIIEITHLYSLRKVKITYRLLILTFITLFNQSWSFANQNVITITENSNVTYVLDKALLYNDTNNVISHDEILNRVFIPFEKKLYGVEPEAFWLKITVRNTSKQSVIQYFGIGTFDSSYFYILPQTEPKLQFLQKISYYDPPAERTLKSFRNRYTLLTIPPGKNIYYIKIFCQSKGSKYVRGTSFKHCFEFFGKEYFLVRLLRNRVHFLLTGALTIVLLFSLFMGFVNKEKVFFLLAFYNLCVIFSIQSSHGIWIINGIVELYEFNRIGSKVFYVMCVLSVGIYAFYVLKIKELFNNAVLLLWGVAFLILLMRLFAYIFYIKSFIPKHSSTCYVVIPIFILINAVLSYLKGNKSALLFLIGFSLVVVTMSNYNYQFLQINQDTNFNRFLVLLATLLESIIFTYLHVSTIEKEKREALEQVNQLTLIQNRRLDKEVKEKTQELIERNERVEVLLKEVHHRVKNNLQTISSLLSLNARKVKSLGAKEVLIDGKDRIKAISALHQNLYQNEGNYDTHVNLMITFNDIIKNIDATYRKQVQKVQIDLEVEHIMMDIDDALNISLILNELVTNSYKHAFKNHPEPQLEVGFKSKQNFYELEVFDNGLEHKKLTSSNNSFGVQLVDLLITQTESIMTTSFEQGTHIHIKIPY
ncbi:MAG: hypothetical protein GY827_05250 [Cytophagales bacterium]|nr:hypothetical protein [Cytophagales bacterium]